MILLETANIRQREKMGEQKEKIDRSVSGTVAIIFLVDDKMTKSSAGTMASIRQHVYAYFVVE